ncbi:MAG: hypothetical protein QM500_13840 [Methylococcales bacterium]
MSAWVNADASGTNNEHTIINTTASSNDTILFGAGHKTSPTHTHRALVRDSNNGNGNIDASVFPEGTVFSGVWKHFVMTYDATTKTVTSYIDGRQTGTDTNTSVALDGNVSYTTIGAGSIGAVKYTGLMDDVKIYTRVLSANDVIELYGILPKISLKAHGGVIQLEDAFIGIGEPLGYTDFTFEGWIQSSATSYFGLLYFDDFDNSGEAGYIGISSGLINVSSGAEGSTYIISSSSINDGAWHHIAIVYNDTDENTSIYIDGNLDAFGSGIVTTTGVTQLGDITNSEFAIIDEFRLWNTIRTSAEINASMKYQLEGNETGLVAYYNFDERAGENVIDFAGNDQNGTIEGNVIRLNFLGDTLSLSSNYIETASNVALESFTTTGWFKPTALSSDWNGLFSTIKDSVNHNFQLVYHNDGNLTLQMVDKTETSFFQLDSIGVNVTDNNWHHLAVTYDASTLRAKIFVDGKLNNSGISSSSFTSLSSLFRIGQNRLGDRAYSGDVAEVSLWNKALSEHQIKKIMHSSLRGNENNLIGYWPLDEGTGTTAYDRSTNSNDGNITGADWNNTAPPIYGNKVYLPFEITSRVKFFPENNTTSPTYTVFGFSINDLNQTLPLVGQEVGDSFQITLNDSGVETNTTFYLNYINAGVPELFYLEVNQSAGNIGLINGTQINTVQLENIFNTSLSINSIAVQDLSGQFTATDGGCVSIASNGYCSPTITFTPKRAGYSAANLLVDFTTSGGTQVKQNILVYGYGKGFAQSSGGYSHTLFLQSDGTVKSVGSNSNGGLGNGTTTDSNESVDVSNLTNVVAVAAGAYYSLALKDDGTLWSWGLNDFGQLGDGTTTNSTVPVQVGISGIVAIDTYASSSFALDENGTLWAWGKNASGELCLGDVNQRVNPTEVNIIDTIANVASGKYLSLALTNGGEIFSCGSNTYGELGDGTVNNSYDAVEVKSTEFYIDLTAGTNHSMALKPDGSVQGWGNNVYGRIGYAIETNITSPIDSNLSNIVKLSAGEWHTHALKSDNTIVGVGENFNGQLGLSTFDSTAHKTEIIIDNNMTFDDISSGWYHGTAIENNSTFVTWGENISGQLGTNDGINASANNKINRLALNAINFLLELLGINLSGHSLTNIQIIGQDGNVENFSFPASSANRDLNVSGTALNSDNNFSFRFDADGTQWYYNFIDNKLYQDNNGSTDFKNEINSSNFSFSIDLNSSNWIAIPIIPTIPTLGQIANITVVKNFEDFNVTLSFTSYTDDIVVILDYNSSFVDINTSFAPSTIVLQSDYNLSYLTIRPVLDVVGDTSVSIFFDNNGTIQTQEFNVTIAPYGVEVKSGWNLLSLPVSAELNAAELQNTFGTNSAIKTLYKFNRRWSYWDNKSGYDINKSMGKFTSLRSNEGFWLDALNDANITYNFEGNVSDVNVSSKIYRSGWYMIGFHEDKTVEEIVSIVNENNVTDNNDSVDYIYRYEQGSGTAHWEIYTPYDDLNASVNTSLKRIDDNISRYEAVWIYVRTN